MCVCGGRTDTKSEEERLQDNMWKRSNSNKKRDDLQSVSLKAGGWESCPERSTVSLGAMSPVGVINYAPALIFPPRCLCSLLISRER